MRLNPRTFLLAFYFLFFFVTRLNSQNALLDSLLTVYRADSIHATSRLLNHIGSVYYARYDLEGYNQALHFHQMGLNAARKSGDEKMIAVSYRLIAAVYDATNMNLDTAAAYYQHYLNYQIKMQDTIRIIDGYRNLLVTYFKLKKDQLEIADRLYAYLRAYDGTTNPNYKNQLSIFYSQHNDNLRAQELFTEINSDVSAGEDPETFRNYFYAKHYLFRAQKKYKDAVNFLESMLTKAKFTIDSISITKCLSEHYQDLGDYKNAFRTLEINSALTYRLETESGKNRIAETASYYLNEEKEKERVYFREKAASETRIKNFTLLTSILLGAFLVIILYFSLRTAKQNNILKKQKDELGRLNDEKTLYLKEIHHRVKNNLQIISSMLDLQVHDLKDQKAIEALREMQMRVYSMAVVHKNLYEKEDLDHIDLRFYLENLFATIYNTFRDTSKQVTFRVEANGILLGIDHVIPLGLIVNELITNSLKYAFINRTEGHISITVSQIEKGRFEFRYGDNGSGLVSDIMSSGSFGLKLVRLMAKKLKGTLNFENTANGLNFFFNFITEEQP